MAIVAFWSDEEKETGQTMSMVALATYMAIEHNYRILEISASFKEKSLENSYWDFQKLENMVKNISEKSAAQAGFESGVEGLIRVIDSNKTSNSIVASHTKVVFRDRLDVLCAPNTTVYEEYKNVCEAYPEILKVANRDYDLVFIDVSRRMQEESIRKILDTADVVVVNITQRLKTIDKILEIKTNDPEYNKKKILINIGRYDQFSKYNEKNVERYLKEKNIFAIPYNTLFFESCAEGNVAEFFLRVRKVDLEDRNGVFINEIKKFANGLVYRLRELQVKI